MSAKQEQQIMLSEELRTAVRLIKAGLCEISRIDGANDFFHLPILLLSSGIERFMKVVICCHYLELNKHFPDKSIFPKGKNGHDLVWLLNKITNECFSDNYLKRIPAAQTDVNFLRSNERLTKIVKIISDFGQSARYYNLNVVLGDSNPGLSPDQEWGILETEILQDDPTWKQRIVDPQQSHSVHQKINKELMSRCERLLQSLSRLFTIGGLGEFALQISFHTSTFLCLQDE